MTYWAEGGERRHHHPQRMMSTSERFGQAAIGPVGAAIHARIRQVHRQQNLHQISLDSCKKMLLLDFFQGKIYKNSFDCVIWLKTRSCRPTDLRLLSNVCARENISGR